jgi:RNA polymerase sigma-70 factor, ECF subfamily
MEREIPIRALQAPDCGLQNVSEAQLIARAQRGDEEAFEALFERHKRRVYSLCLRMTRSAADAEDLTQEALLQFFRKLPTFRGESTLATWLHRMAVNVVLMHLRKKRLQQVPFDEAGSEQDPPKRQYGAPDERLTGCALRVSLERAIASLPSGYRSIYVLHEIHGYEHAEIAQMMNCTPGNSKSQLHKARLKLRYLLHSAGAKANAAMRTAKGRKTLIQMETA